MPRTQIGDSDEDILFLQKNIPKTQIGPRKEDSVHLEKIKVTRNYKKKKKEYSVRKINSDWKYLYDKNSHQWA